MRSLISREESAVTASFNLDSMRLAQRRWARVSVARRLRLVRGLRHRIAAGSADLAATVPSTLPGALHRTTADTLASEILPLLEACRFLERDAEAILRTRYVGHEGRSLLLGSVTARVEREPWGIVLIIAPANYPLLLAGVQALQALVAGNAVLWKPAPGTETCAFALKTLLVESGLDADLVTVLPSGIESAESAIAAGVDHVVLTGSAQTGRAVLHQLAETLTPATMELSGCDAAFLLPGADYNHAIRALAFGQRFNGSATCMAPRRVFLVGLTASDAIPFEAGLAAALGAIAPIPLSPATMQRLSEILADARDQQAEVVLDGLAAPTPEDCCRPTLITRATPALRSMQADIFAPVLSVMSAANAEEALAAYAACPYALTVSVFGPERAASRFAQQIKAGNIVINDLIIPTADPRIPFGGRGRSGFGVTRGAEGLLAMTTPRTIQTQRAAVRRSYDPTAEDFTPMFSGLAEALHGSGFARRCAGLAAAVRSAMRASTTPTRPR
jgi:aldehyde dehydrogenase (NAD+)